LWHHRANAPAHPMIDPDYAFSILSDLARVLAIGLFVLRGSFREFRLFNGYLALSVADRILLYFAEQTLWFYVLFSLAGSLAAVLLYLSICELWARLAGEKVLSKRVAVGCPCGLLAAASLAAAGGAAYQTSVARLANSFSANLFLVCCLAMAAVFGWSLLVVPAHRTARRIANVLALYVLLLASGSALSRRAPGLHILSAMAGAWLPLGSGFALMRD
jgi:hypothetical protein